MSSRPSVQEGSPVTPVAGTPADGAPLAGAPMADAPVVGAPVDAAPAGWMPDFVVGRIAHRLHVPFLAVALVAGALLMIPVGQIAPAGSDWVLVNQDALGMGVIRGTSDVIFWILLASLVAYDLVAMRWMRLQTRSRLAEVRDLMPIVAEDGRDPFARARDWRPPAIASALYVGYLIVDDIRGGHVVPPEGIALYATDVAVFFVRWFVLAAFVWMYAASLFGLYRVCRRPMRLVPHLDDPYLGTRPFGRLSLAFAIAFFAGAAILGLWVSASPTSPRTVIVYAAVLVAGLALFFGPLYAVHLQMSMTKRTEQAASAARFRRIFDDTRRQVDAGSHEMDLADVHAAIGWGFVDARVRAIRTWPFDTAIVFRLLTMFALPVVLAIITRIAVRATLGD